MDFYGGNSPPTNGFKYILTVRDSYTRYTWLIPTKDTSYHTVATAHIYKIFCYFGIPSMIRSENHNSFTSDLLREVGIKLKIEITTIPTFNYHSNIAKRVHFYIGRFLRVTLDENSLNDWASTLPYIALAINSTRYRILEVSTLFLMFCRSLMLPH